MNELLAWSDKQSPALAKAERTCLQHIVPTLRGYHLLLLGSNKPLKWLPEHCLHAFSLAPQLSNTKSHVKAHFEYLPLRDSSIDAAVIPYLLEYAENPEQLLNELFRTLIAEGKCLIFGFQRLHPWCWLNGPSSTKSLQLWQVKRLLARTKHAINKIHWLHYGAIYCIETQKHVTAVTPLRPQWSKPILEKTWQPTARKAG